MDLLNPDDPTFFTVLTARDPKWANAENTAINLYVLFYGHQASGEVPFGASPLDPEAHGRDIYRRALAGEFGVVAPFALSPADANAQVSRLTSEATARIDALQLEVNTLQDAVDLEMATPEEAARLPLAKTELANWKRYRVLLSRVPAQPGFPGAIDWPVKPA